MGVKENVSLSKIAILTDSACDIPPELERKYGIDILCFSIMLDGKSYTERKDFSFEEYYDLLRNAKGIPSTAHVTHLAFCAQYCKYVDEGYTEVLHVTINSTGSATYDAARMAISMLDEERPGHKLKIHLIDSHTYSMVYGWYVCEAARKIRNGAEVAPIAAWLDSVFARAEAVLAAYSLKVMKKSGRVSAAAAFAGELLGLRPVISLIDGESKVVAKVRGDAGVLPALVKFAKEHRGEEPEYMVGTTDDARGEELAKLCKKELGCAPLCIFKLGAAVASNTGPDAIALIYLGQPRR